MIIALLAMRFMAFPWWMPVMAETTDVISTNAVTGIISAIFAGIALVVGKFWGKRQAVEERSTTIKGQPVRVKVEGDDDYVTNAVLEGHLDRIEATFTEIKEVLDSERGIARTANGNIHKRIDALSERLGDRLSSLEGTTKAINETVGKLLDLALGKPSSQRK